MLSSNRGFDFLAILLEMDRCGYDVQWQLLNSKYHGVPQNRERVYIVGCLRGKCSSKIFPFEGTDTENSVQQLDVQTVGHRKLYNNNTVIVNPNGIARTLDTAGGGRELHITVDTKNNCNKDKDYETSDSITPVCIGGFGEKKSNSGSQFYQQDRIYSSDTVSPSLTNNLPGGSNRVAIPVLTPEREKKRQNGRRFKEDGDPFFTLTGQDRHGVAIGFDVDGQIDSENDKDNMFVIDKGVHSKEREVANCIEAREDRGLSNHKQEGTLVCIKMK